MQRNRYSKEFKEQALSKARQRGLRTLECVATELNLPLGSLKSWLKTSNQKALASGTVVNLPQDRAAAHYSPAQRLLALPGLDARFRSHGAMPEPVGLVARLHDVAMVSQPVQ